MLRFPLIMQGNNEQSTADQYSKKMKRVIISANLVFYTLVALWIAEAEFVPDKPIPLFIRYTDAALKALCISVLLYSLKRLQTLVKSAK